jgi:hypothetical protein
MLYLRHLHNCMKGYKEGLLATRGGYIASPCRPWVANKPFFMSARRNAAIQSSLSLRHGLCSKELFELCIHSQRVGALTGVKDVK